jgi:hypothetical protein
MGISIEDKALLIKAGLFVLAGMNGMLFAYYRKWSYDQGAQSLRGYMLGDMHAVGRAVTTLIAMCVGAGSLSYLDGMTTTQILIAGAGIGLLVPENVNKGN